jgi:heme oxygenase
MILPTLLDLSSDLGARFYEFDAFPSIGAIQEFKGKYRDALNSLPVDDKLAQKISLKLTMLLVLTAVLCTV